MPYIIISSWWPSHKNDEVVDKYLEVIKKYPQSKIPGKLIVPIAATNTKNGGKSIRIREIKTDDAQGLADALTMTGEQMNELTVIEGYEYKVRIWSTVAEALASIKREGPE